MDKIQFATWVMALKTYYPDPKLVPNDAARELWFKQLKDIDYELAEMALNRWVAVNRWPPTIADIRSEAFQVVKGDDSDWGEGWEQVLRAIRFYGSYREIEAYHSMDVITQKVVKRLGFRNLCMSENEAADRANFRDIYNEIAKRQEKNNLLSGELKFKISAYRQQAIESKGDMYG